MDVLLIKVPYRISDNEVVSSFDYDAPPLGIFTLKAYLKSLHYDAHAIHMITMTDFNTVERIIKESKPKIIGLSATTYEYLQAINLAKKLKKINAKIPIVIGGPHVSHNYEEALSNEQIDIVSRFEGEETFRELIESYNGHEFLNLKMVKGIAFRNNREIYVTPEREYIDLDKIPIIDYSEMNLSRYHQGGILVTSRGCVGRCIFCTAAHTKYRERSAGKVFEDMSTLYHQGIKQIAILENAFTINEKRTRDVCNLIIDNNLPIQWSCEARVETSRDLLCLMKKAGCYAVQFGIESANDITLANVRKGINIRQITRAIDNALEVEIDNICCNYIIGLPGDTTESLKDTLNYMRKYKKNPKVRQSVSVLAPYPGTYIYEHADELGVKILSKDWKRYNGMDVVCETSQLSEKVIRDIYFDAYNEFYINSYDGFL